MRSKCEEFPSPTEPGPDKAACQMFCWYNVRNVSHGSDTVKCCQSRADLCGIFAQSLVGRVCRFCGGLFPSWRLSHTQSPPGQVACNPSCVSARQVAERGRVSSLHAPGSWQPGEFDDVCLSVLTTDWQWSTDDIWYIVLVIYLILRRCCVFISCG